MDNKIEMRFKSKRVNIVLIRNIIGTIIVDENPTMSFINEVKTIVSEAITNAIVHGYSNMEDQIIDVSVNVTKDVLAIDIKDYGKGIENIEKAKEPLFTTLESEERSGLGFTIMELFSDKLEIESKLGEGTHLYIEKNW